MYVIGIDPGLKGAIALVTPSYNCIVHDVPTVQVIGAKRKMKSGERKNKVSNLMDVAEVVKLLKFWKEQYTPLIVYLENVHSMPTDGAMQAFNFGQGFGMYRGILGALEMRYELVAPQTWGKVMLKDMGKNEDASYLKARQLFPSAVLNGPRGAKLDGRADALLIAEYGRRIHLVNNPLF